MENGRGVGEAVWRLVWWCCVVLRSGGVACVFVLLLCSCVVLCDISVAEFICWCVCVTVLVGGDVECIFVLLWCSCVVLVLQECC